MTAQIPSRAPSARRSRPWFPLCVTVMGVIGMAVVLALPDFERNLTRWVLMSVPLLVLLLNGLWFLFTPRYSSRTRGLGLLGLGLLGLGLKASLKVDGTSDGTGMPRLAWRWSAPSGREFRPVAGPLAPGAVEDPLLQAVRDVPQFFGPKGDGVVTGAGVAGDWKAHPPRERWRQPVGGGWSAFAVSGGLAYTQEQREGEEMVTCYEILTGTPVWTHADRARFSQWQSGDGPHGTPTVAGGRVFSFGGSGLLTCLDARTGSLLWQRDILKEYHQENLEWGISASPLTVDGLVVVTGGKTPGPALFAFRQDTGEPAWQAGRDAASYASPSLTTLAGRRVILVQHARALAAYDPGTGGLLLEYPWGNEKWPKASQPVVIGGQRVFVSAGYGVGCQLLEITAGPDGKLSGTELWSNLKLKTQFNSVAFRDGYLYGLDDGRMACVEAATGTRLWKEGRYGSGQTLLVDGLAIVQHEDGAVTLAAVSPQGYEERGRLEALSGKTWNHPVLAGRFLLVRNDREAVCYEWPAPP